MSSTQNHHTHLVGVIAATTAMIDDYLEQGLEEIERLHEARLAATAERHQYTEDKIETELRLCELAHAHILYRGKLEHARGTSLEASIQSGINVIEAKLQKHERILKGLEADIENAKRTEEDAITQLARARKYRTGLYETRHDLATACTHITTPPARRRAKPATSNHA